MKPNDRNKSRIKAKLNVNQGTKLNKDRSQTNKRKKIHLSQLNQGSESN